MTRLQWRFIPLIEASGFEQMAIDQWLFEQHCQGRHPPTLRFYTWYPAAISLGYHQKHYPNHWDNLTYQGKPIDLVRRPTGGRAVLHQGDLTYMIVTSGLKGTRYQIYEHLCQFLIEGWRRLGVELKYGKAKRSYIRNPNCFATATSADLIDEQGNKLIGSAQLRREKQILQHGSINLNPNQELSQQVFGKVPVANKRQYPSAADIIASLKVSAQASYGIKLTEQSLLPEEWAKIKKRNQFLMGLS
jgi:lipoate-protein ligase A